jgi:integrase
LKPKTLLGYRSTLNNHVLPFWGGYKVGAVDYEGINAWIDSLSRKHSPSVTRGAYKILRLVLGHAVRLRKIAFNPATDIALPKVPHSEMLFLTHSEVDRLADALSFRPRTSKHDPGRPDRPQAWATRPLRRLHRSACRRDCRSPHQASRPSAPSVRVEQCVSDVNGHLEFDTPKTKAGRRTVPLPEFLVPQLTTMIAHRRLDPNAFVFVSEQGGPFGHANFMKRFWHEATSRAGLPPTLRFHDVRHTCASFLVESNVHPKEMSEWLGHSSIVITLDRYSHVFPQLTAAVARRLDSARARALATNETLAPVVPLR